MFLTPYPKFLNHFIFTFVFVLFSAQVATELAGGPSFADFDFEPGRITGEGVASDGTIAPPLGNNNMLRDFFYRASLDDLDIVAISGAHTLGGGQGTLSKNRLYKLSIVIVTGTTEIIEYISNNSLY